MLYGMTIGGTLSRQRSRTTRLLAVPSSCRRPTGDARRDREPERSHRGTGGGNSVARAIGAGMIGARDPSLVVRLNGRIVGTDATNNLIVDPRVLPER
jgi:hypothetical protein